MKQFGLRRQYQNVPTLMITLQNTWWKELFSLPNLDQDKNRQSLIYVRTI